MRSWEGALASVGWLASALSISYFTLQVATTTAEKSETDEKPYSGVLIRCPKRKIKGQTELRQG